MPEIAGDSRSANKAANSGNNQGGSQAGGNGDMTATTGSESAGSKSGDGELARALEDFDGDILDERLPAAERAGITRAEQTGGGASSKDKAERGASPRAPAMALPGSRTPNPPAPDLPDARDDDVVARQIREAAMAEPDPELREALWKEYKRYKAGL